jgi:DNA-binding MarR family transcriptional regulator
MSVTTRKTDPRFAPPEDDAARQIRALIEITRLFRDLAPTLPVSYMQAFLEVALHPGGGSTDHMGALETIQPVMSRILLHLGSKERRQALGEGGYKLIESAPDPMDLRRDRYFLTPKGKALLAGLQKALDRTSSK